MLGRVTFSPDTTSGGSSPRVILRGLPIIEKLREKENLLIFSYDDRKDEK